MVSRAYRNSAFLKYLTGYGYLRSRFRSGADELCLPVQHTREYAYAAVLILAGYRVNISEHHILCGESESGLLARHCVYIRTKSRTLALGIAEDYERQPVPLFKGQRREEVSLVDMRKTRYHNGHTGRGSRSGTVFRKLPRGIEKIFH